jgi:hypothetical protein
MKKLFVIVLLLVYGVASTGATLHFHYCCGKLDKIDLSPVKHKGCGTDHEFGKKSCCDNKEVTLNIGSDQSLIKYTNPSFSHLAVKAAQPEFFILGLIELKKSGSRLFAPPPLQKDLNTLFCTYRV